MADLVTALLRTDDHQIETRWQQLMDHLTPRFGSVSGIESLLFLVGIQARGQGFQPKLGKEAKQELIMEGTYLVFETLGLYQREVTFQNGRTLWQKAVTYPAGMSLEDQEKLLRIAILAHFERIWPALSSPTSILDPTEGSA